MNGKIITGLAVAGVFACGWFSHEFFGGRSAARETGSAAERFRAVMMTAFTFVLGVLLVPGLYVIFQRIGDWYERRT